jgi:hypothetical protein
MKKSIPLFILLLFLTKVSFEQDTTKVDKPNEYNKGWTKGVTSGRLEIGIQKLFYYELGVSRVAYLFDGSGIGAIGYYAMAEVTPSKNIYGLKIGCETNLMALGIGLDLRYLTDNIDKDFVITPKIGIGGASFIILFYGYNFSTNNSPFSAIGQHQISLVCNINKAILTGKNYKY